MKEQIEEDRKTLKNQTLEENNHTFTYIKYLLPPKDKKIGVAIKLHKMSTLNILYYLEESFKMGDRYVLRSLDIIEKELKSRMDLFHSVLKFLQNSIVIDSLFYWVPGFSINNVFCFITKLIPDFIEKYKEYFIYHSKVGDLYIDCLYFIKERYRKEYEQFIIMKEDLLLFENCLSHPYWSEELSDCTCKFLNIENTIIISEDIEGIFIPNLSFVDFNINQYNFVVSIEHFEGLINKNEKFKEFWKDKKVVNDAWEFLI